MVESKSRRRCGRPVMLTPTGTTCSSRCTTCASTTRSSTATPTWTTSATPAAARPAATPDALAEWTDWDGAAFALGRSIGMFERPDDFQRVKGLFWTDNPTGAGLHRALLALAEAEVLEHRDEPDLQFRWRRPSR